MGAFPDEEAMGKVQHFLITSSIPAGHADVRPFGSDYAAAPLASDEAEELHSSSGSTPIM